MMQYWKIGFVIDQSKHCAKAIFLYFVYLGYCQQQKQIFVSINSLISGSENSLTSYIHPTKFVVDPDPHILIDLDF